MANRSIQLTDALYSYLVDHSLREPDVLRRVRDVTASLPEHSMQIAPEQGQFMAMLAKITGARRALEIGVFTGYSSLAVSLALPPDGRLIACDVSTEYTDIAKKFWKEAGVDHKIDLRIGPASETLERLLQENPVKMFDMVFIDADKEGYDLYYEQSLRLVRSGGIILLDNMLRGGRVLDPEADDSASRAIIELNDKLHNDRRIDLSLLPIADGLTIARKR